MFFYSRSYRSSKATSPETDGDVMDESESASSSSMELPGGPVSNLVRRMRETLASLRKTVAWYPPAEDSACSASERSASTKATTATHGDAAHDLTCVTTILERLVASGRIHQIAKNLVSQVQGAIRDSGPASIPVAAGKSLSDSVLFAKVKAAPKRTLSASHIIHTFAEEAIKNLLQPYFLPFVALSASDITSSGSYASSRPRSATSKGPSPSLLGLEKDECSCLMTKLMQRLPADISLRESVGSSRPFSAPHGRVTASPSQGFSEVADLFTRVMTFQVMDMIDSELKRHEQARFPSPDQEESAIEGAASIVSDAVSGWSGGLFSGLIQRFLSEFLPTESALSDGSSRSLSTRSCAACRVESAPQSLKNVLELFTRVMVSQVMDIIKLESPVELVSPIAEERPCSSASRPSSAKFSLLGSETFTDGTSVAGSDSSDNGCLVTALMLRLLVKLRDQSTASPGTVESSRELIGKILSEFSSVTGTPDFQTYPNNVKIQTIYKAMDKFLIKEFGPEAVLQRAVDEHDESFDTILLSALRKELLPGCDAEVTTVPSPQSSSALTACPSVPRTPQSHEPVQGVEDGRTAREKPRRWLNIKVWQKTLTTYDLLFTNERPVFKRFANIFFILI